MNNQYAEFEESIRHKINSSLRVFINRLHANFPPHWHTDIEIIWPKEAPYKVVCGNQSYYVDIGDIILICPAIIHEIFSPSPGARVYIQVDFSKVSVLKELNSAFRMMSPALHIRKSVCPPDVYEQLCDYINRIMKLYFGDIPSLHAVDGKGDQEESIIAFTELEPYDKLEIYSLLMQFIAFCGKNMHLFQNAGAGSALSVPQNNVLLNNVCTYISEHFTEDLSLEGIAAYAGFSKYHFERIFSEYTGVTFYQYLQQMRINYAQTLLSNSALSITDISYQAGFASSTAFTRAFKKGTGYPPSEFRMLNEDQHPIAVYHQDADGKKE
ncbi:MAG: helix-turn-helix transcriptional regulator [Treponema sp.]|nr:helix-turn-helix transcriptional regulator [Candidatus Treponema caballi]